MKKTSTLIAAAFAAFVLAACGGGGDNDCAAGEPLYGNHQGEHYAACPNKAPDGK